MFSFLTRSDGIDISASEFRERLAKERGEIIDVRTKAEYDEGHLELTDKLYDFNSGEFHEHVNELDKEKTYYLYCRSGNRSGQAARLLKSKGFENVYNVGGFEDLVRAGFEVEK